VETAAQTEMDEVATYDRAVEKFDRYEAILDEGIPALVAKLKGLI
jgi:hypothetical protein